MSESSMPFPPPPPQMSTPTGNVLGRGIPSLHKTLFGISIAALCGSVLVLFATINQYQFLSDVKNGNFDSEYELINKADQVDSFTSTANTSYFLTIAALMIAFMVWCNKTTKNLNESGYRTEKSSGWAVGSFFIPIVNIFMVFGIIKDLLTGLGRFIPQLTSSRQVSMKTWWIVTIIGAGLLRASNFDLADDAIIDDYINAATFQVFAALVLVVGLSFGVKAFKQLRDDTKMF